MEADVNEIVKRLAGNVADLTVRLAVAEARLHAYEQAEVDGLADEEQTDG